MVIDPHFSKSRITPTTESSSEPGYSSLAKVLSPDENRAVKSALRDSGVRSPSQLIASIAKKSNVTAEEMDKRLRNAMGNTDFYRAMTAMEEVLSDWDKRKEARSFFWREFLNDM